MVSPIFDPYLIPAFVPDHCLSGIIENVVAVCFEQIPKGGERKRQEYRILEDMSTNGLGGPRHIIWNAE